MIDRSVPIASSRWVWDGNRDTARAGAALHDDMTSAPAHLDGPVLLKDPTDFASRQDAKSTHVSLRSSLQMLPE
jgi:hypothetical protein